MGHISPIGRKALKPSSPFEGFSYARVTPTRRHAATLPLLLPKLAKPKRSGNPVRLNVVPHDRLSLPGVHIPDPLG